MAARSRKSTLDIETLRRQTAKGTWHGVYCVSGSESLLADEAVDLLVSQAIPVETRDFNLNLYSGDDEAGRQFLSQAQSFPFMAERRVVVVRRFEKMSFDARSEAALIEYLTRPVPSTVLVLVGKLDRRKKITQVIEKHACMVDASELPERALPGWVQQRFRERGVQAAQQVCEQLVQLVGSSLLDLRNEIDKVVARYGEQQEIGEGEILDTVGHYRQEEIWAVSRAFRQDNMAGFLAALSRVLEVRDEPIGVAALLANRVNSLLRIKLLQSRGVRSRNDVARRARIPPFLVEEQLHQASTFSARQLGLWLRNLQVADVQMKSVRLPQRYVLERALVNSFLGQDMA
jgi:DNA polymerase-3 subunit delta